ncbi:uncharacterized protein LOC125491394 [Plutella xylostella]|uniref:uncharacterized protein LOC125491394 n=1 Tax=Plutella xylostella TaxID=51655 RepID=UPI0020331AC0|nr:uncharacterized protein LOC125491394 [Plutella xylostella]
MAKCAKCNKLVTKKSPGLQCSKCSKWIHAQCASITADQLSALNSTDSVDWKCRPCNGSARPKRLSCIMPDADDEEATDSEQQQPTNSDITQHMLSQIRREVREAIRMEMQQALSFFSDKIDEYEEKINIYEQERKNMEKQQQELKNNLNTITLRNNMMEQRINMLEQLQINNNIEICGIKEEKDENLTNILNTICSKLQQKPADIQKVFRKKSRQTNNNRREHSAVTVILRDGCRNQWVNSARDTPIHSRDLGIDGDNRIYIREELTPSTAFLLWKTKMELKEKHRFKFVWIKHGNIMARKNENEKYFVIRSQSDIERAVTETQDRS